MKTLRHTQLTLQFVRSKGVQVRFHGRGKNEASHYCGQCEEEVFNILFIKEQEKKHVVHCLHCSRRHSPNLEGFVCLEEYHMEDLIEVYDSFVLHPVSLRCFCISIIVFSHSTDDLIASLQTVPQIQQQQPTPAAPSTSTASTFS